jgi:hypothetical protein
MTRRRFRIFALDAVLRKDFILLSPLGSDVKEKVRTAIITLYNRLSNDTEYHKWKSAIFLRTFDVFSEALGIDPRLNRQWYLQFRKYMAQINTGGEKEILSIAIPNRHFVSVSSNYHNYFHSRRVDPHTSSDIYSILSKSGIGAGIIIAPFDHPAAIGRNLLKTGNSRSIRSGLNPSLEQLKETGVLTAEEYECLVARANGEDFNQSLLNQIEGRLLGYDEEDFDEDDENGDDEEENNED